MILGFSSRYLRMACASASDGIRPRPQRAFCPTFPVRARLAATAAFTRSDRRSDSCWAIHAKSARSIVRTPSGNAAVERKGSFKE